jgi:hypothetical protein
MLDTISQKRKRASPNLSEVTAFFLINISTEKEIKEGKAIIVTCCGG